jgi:hypothetical protein
LPRVNTAMKKPDISPEGLEAEHRVVAYACNAITTIADDFPDADIENMLSSIIANLMLQHEAKPLRWLETVSNMAFRKLNMMRELH